MNPKERKIPKKSSIISLKNVSLTIPVFQKMDRSIKKSLLRSATGGLIAKTQSLTSVKALRSINIDISKGDRIALIGQNGSGKTSFLKLISGIYEPSKGVIEKNVEVYPMIQKSFIVANELSGLDAAKSHYLLINNSLLGFEDFLEDIVTFSGLGEFITFPLKTYSEGMASRLLFSLLTYHSHDCLALDEGLGTGDQSFYNKAAKRLDGFIQKSGTLIFASHSNELLKQFCTRGLVFSKGSIIFDGTLTNALLYYAENFS